MIAVQAECAAWFEALPESLHDGATAAALQELIDLNGRYRRDPAAAWLWP